MEEKKQMQEALCVQFLSRAVGHGGAAEDGLEFCEIMQCIPP